MFNDECTRQHVVQCTWQEDLVTTGVDDGKPLNYQTWLGSSFVPGCGAQRANEWMRLRRVYGSES